MVNNVKVTIDMYSGLPNPEIELTRQEDNALIRLVTVLTRSEVMDREKAKGIFVDTPTVPQLGYRGFKFQWGGNKTTAYFHCYEGLYFKTTTDMKWLLLPDLGIEKYLKAIARQHGYEFLS